jgi:hypothetical protein
LFYYYKREVAVTELEKRDAVFSCKTNEGMLIDSMELHRGSLAVHERKFCERAERFIEHILPIEIVAQCEKANGLIFGTQTLTSIITDRKGYNKVTRDNLKVVDALCKYVAKAYMVIGNMRKPRKAIYKKVLWHNEFSLAKKLKHVVDGPVNPDALRIWIEEYYRRNFAGLVVLMMDSGGHKDYSPVMAELTKKYDNLYIMKMILVGSYSLRLLRAYRGDVSVMNNRKFSNCYKAVKKKGWEYARKHPELLDGLFEKLNLT